MNTLKAQPKVGNMQDDALLQWIHHTCIMPCLSDYSQSSIEKIRMSGPSKQPKVKWTRWTSTHSPYSAHWRNGCGCFAEHGQKGKNTKPLLKEQKYNKQRLHFERVAVHLIRNHIKLSCIKKKKRKFRFSTSKVHITSWHFSVMWL